ncbi:4-(cytidine 5'-diphospho)-2-C-methyl-D-erythritol kinase [Ferruginibacter yonginensis]|uniref:4-diphosphocytidyl-2-C-methyl-D-erythritol kinase n=1 Tax=Ferruginibacter yonginensis TaxID=1310416 RepID=A0ABV8QPQ6_9BACT
MLAFPNCKINIGLNIVGKRVDGFHDIETIFYPIAIKDAVEIVETPQNSDSITFTSTGLQIDGSTADNLCVKAYHLLKNEYPQISTVHLHLHKNIPLGAGLGGGSADATAVLQMLNQLYQLNLGNEKLMQYALQLGSDCPFFVLNQPSFATGRGEILTPTTIDLSGYHFVIVNPSIHVNTGAAFKALNVAAMGSKNLQENVQADITTWKNTIVNDFEVPVFQQHPAIAIIKETLYQQGAIYSAMSGSGSTVFGIFKDAPSLNNFKFPAHYFCEVV